MSRRALPLSIRPALLAVALLVAALFAAQAPELPSLRVRAQTPDESHPFPADVRTPITDVHAHALPPEYTRFIVEHGAGMEETFPLPSWDEQSHLAFMDRAGIARSVLTMPAPHPHFGDTKESVALIRRVNDFYADLKKRHPDRFLFCAALPLPDVEAAMAEARRAFEELGADGVKLATNHRGLLLGDPALAPLMDLLNGYGAVIILHPHRPTPVNGELAARMPLPVYEYPAETTRAVLSLITRNVLVRHPCLKVVVPHCGSFLPLALPRLRALLPSLVGGGYMKPADIDANLARLHYDLAGNPAPAVLEALLSITTPDHLLYGSDWPYLPPPVLENNLKKLRATLAANPRLAPHADDILYRNALRLFAQDHADRGPKTAAR